MNKIEEYKKEKDGYDVLPDVPRYAQEGWEALTDGDRERLKWVGIFFRRQTPGHFMMRLRLANGISNAAQFRTIAAISQEFGKGFADLTTRQQIQLRWFRMENVPEIWHRLEQVGLGSLQTGMDNIRGVMGCPVAGLTPHELFDASPVTRQYTELFLRNKAYTNLPRKFNVTITACLDNCTPVASQDIGLTPAIKELQGAEIKGFNVTVGGKLGSGGYTLASSLDLFVCPEEAAAICCEITLLFRDYGPREARTKARLAFLLQDWGVAKFRQKLEQRVGHPLLSAGKDMRGHKTADHTGIFRQKQQGRNYVGLVVPAGRISAPQLFGIADLAERYGNGEIRLTPGQNVIIRDVPDNTIGDLIQEPLLRELRYDSSEFMRGLVSCTGSDYCHFSLIETKQRAIEVARYLEQRLGNTEPLTIHWSGCPNGCGNHATADVGLLGKKIRLNGHLVDAVDVFVGGRAGLDTQIPLKLLEDVPCATLPQVLEHLVPYLVRHKKGMASVGGQKQKV